MSSLALFSLRSRQSARVSPVPRLECLEDRLLLAGALDHSFNVTGQVITSFAATSTDWGTSVAAQSDGRIVVAGTSSAQGQPDLALVRLNQDGSLDETFGQAGKVVLPVNTDVNVAVDTDV